MAVGVRRRAAALLLTLLLLSTAGCWKMPDILPGGGAEVSTRPALDGNTPPIADSETQDPANTADLIDPTAPADPTYPIDPTDPNVPADPEKPTSLQDRIFIPLVVVVAVLLAAVAWLLWDRLRKRGSDPASGQGQGDTPVPSTRAPSSVLPDYQVGNLHNIGRRGEQQDSFCLSDVRDGQALAAKGLMAVVADGMGGLESGAAVSQLVTDTFLSRYRQLSIPDADAFLLDAAAAAEEAVEKYMEQTGSNSGSTLVAVLLRGDRMHFISVGDSHIYLLRGDQLIQVNKDHNYGALLMERAARGEVDPEEPYVNPRRHALTAYIGMGSLNLVDRNQAPIVLLPGDKVLLCSDGVYNALGSDALRAAMAGDAHLAAQRLEAAVLEQGLSNQDNFTAVLVEWRRSG